MNVSHNFTDFFISIKNIIFSHSEYKLGFTYEATNKIWYLNIPILGKYYKLSNLIKSQKLFDFLSDEDFDIVYIKVKPQKTPYKYDNYFECIRTKHSIIGGSTYSVSCNDSLTFDMWISPITLCVLGYYPRYLYIRKCELMEVVLETSIKDLNIQYNKVLLDYFRIQQINTIGDLIKYRGIDVLHFPGMNSRIITELDDALEVLSLKWASTEV